MTSSYCKNYFMFAVVNFDALADEVIFETKGDKLSSSAECRIQSWEVWDTKSPADWMPTHKLTELSRIKPVPMMSEHSAQLTSLPTGFRTWLWRYTCLLLLILMFWQRQVIFESKRDKLSSSAEGKINSLAPESDGCNFRFVIFELILGIDIFIMSGLIALRWMPQDLTDDSSTLVQVMACCLAAPSHYLNQRWPSSMMIDAIRRH